MTAPAPDHRGPQRRARDEQIVADPPLPPPDLPPGATAVPVEALLAPRHRPVAVAGVVKDGLVRPLDPAVKLPENARVIIVAAGG